METERGPTKKRLKKAASCNTETIIVVAAPTSEMVFPHNEVVDKATHKKKEEKSIIFCKGQQREGVNIHYINKYYKYQICNWIQ